MRRMHCALCRDWRFQQTAHGSEGLWSKAQKQAARCRDLETLFTAVKSKRYPRTRLQRLVMCAYLGISREMLQRTPDYVRVLAFDDAGRAALRQMKQTAKYMAGINLPYFSGTFQG